MSSGFYEGGYSSYGGSGSNSTGGGASGGGYNTYNSGAAGGGGSSDAFSGSMGSSYPQQTTQSQYSQPQQSQKQQGQQQQQQQQHQQQQQQQAPSNPNGMDSFNPANFWNPTMTTMATAAATGQFNSTAAMNVAEGLGKDLFEKGWAKAVPGLERSMIGLRPYFAVDNSYVKRKMIRILFPFLHKEWARNELGVEQDGSVSYALPQQDLNAPDLYIPSMSLLTYVLLCALCYGSAGKFDPEVLPDVTSKCVVTQILEVIAIRIGFYLMEAPCSILDLLSYTGYKYLGLSVNMLSGLTMGHFLGYGHRSYYFTYLWTATAVSYFILKVMANCIPRKTSAAGPKRQAMVLGFAGSQFATCWFVSQTKFLE